MRRARRRSAEWFRGRTRLIARIFSMARMACRYGGGRYLGLDRRIGIRGRRRDGRLGAAYGAGLQEMGGASGCARFRRLSRLRADEPAGALCPIPERISGRRTYGRPCRSLSDRREAQDAYASLFPEACGGRPISRPRSRMPGFWVVPGEDHPGESAGFAGAFAEPRRIVGCASAVGPEGLGRSHPMPVVAGSR